ncbi:hypothetical protein [Marinobacterium mangrovicola]|uniref:Uncharacterized protein n=1 Tax=Marinobacterium mangrovicola TaxID=1476959 RepID=A0A4R1GL31_9GAMM|nr:hypothetical protein [Marinobacterium mangrovicola]TCK09134.1 hypothetical protein CLV83_1237 [Marinobacterium mangrovicola]
MTDKNDGILLADAIQKLFGIKLAKHKKFKEQMESLMRSGLIEYRKAPIEFTASSRNHKLIDRQQLTKLHNAVLLHAFFPMPKVITDIFSDHSKRLEQANVISLLLTGRNSVAGIGLLRQEVLRFLEALKSDQDLTVTRLPNPFQELPQLSFGGISNVMQALLLQSAALSDADSMIAHFLNDDLGQAYRLALEIESDQEIVNLYKQRIIEAHNAASDFDNFLDDIFNQ